MKKLLIVPTVLLCLYSCGRSPEKLAMDAVESYIEQRPDSALAVLRGIDPRRLGGRAEKARYSLLFSMALDKNYIDTTDVGVIRDAVDYYRHEGGEPLLKSLYYLGRIRQNADDYAAAMVSYSEVLDILSTTESPDAEFLCRLYSAIAAVKNMTYDYEESMMYTELTYRSCLETGNTEMIDRSRYILAMEYANNERWESADSLYSVLLAKDDLPEDLRFSVLSSYGFNKVVSTDKDIEGALELFSDAIDLGGGLDDIKDWGAYAYALAISGDYDAAYEALAPLEQADIYDYYYWKALIDGKTGRFEAAYNGLIKAFPMINSSIRTTISQSAAKAQRDYLEDKRIESEEKVSNLRLSLVLFSLCVVLFLVLLYMLFQKRKRAAAKERDDLLMFVSAAKERQTEIEDKFEREQRYLRDSFVDMYKKQFDFFSSVSEAVLAADRSDKDEYDRHKEVYDNCKILIRDIVSDKEGQERFEAIIDERMGGLMSRFRSDFPGMNDNSYRFVSFLFARFSTNMMTILLKYPSAAAVYTRKSRIKKMIESSSVADKDIYLKILD